MGPPMPFVGSGLKRKNRVARRPLGYTIPLKITAVRRMGRGHAADAHDYEYGK